jgi:uncharacterized protein YeaC (DUF1315 family)
MREDKPATIEALIESITPEIHQKLKTAVELGKWESGERLSREQLEHCLQAIIAWEHRHLPVNDRVGFISPDTLRATGCKPERGTLSFRKGDSQE